MLYQNVHEVNSLKQYQSTFCSHVKVYAFIFYEHLNPHHFVKIQFISKRNLTESLHISN